MGKITRYADDPNVGATSQQRLNDAGDIFKGLTVGRVAAVKYLDPRTSREELRFAFVFNETTDKPTVAFLPKSVELEGVREDIAKLVADKVIRFEEFMTSRTADSVESGKVAEL